MTRRTLVGLAATAGLGTALTGCRVQTTSDDGGAGGAAQSGKIKFPEPAVELPTEDVTYRAMMSGGIKQPYFEAVWKAFHDAHPNITMQLDATDWKRINEVVPLGVRNNTAPDMFQKPQNVPVQVMVNEGWVAPLDDIIPDFQEWKKNYPAGAFIPGVHVFNGKTYSWTFTSSRSQYGHLLFFDSALMSKAEVDPTAERLTWDTFRSTAKKITDQGDGNSYGLFIGGSGKLGSLTMELAQLAGLAGGEMDFSTGEYNFTKPLLRDAIDLMLAIKDDGSMFPGYISLTQNEVDARFPQGKAGMTFSGAWDIPNWERDAPDYEYGLAMPPMPNSEEFHHTGFTEGTAAPLYAYANSKYPEITGELLRYMGSVEGQVMLIILTKGIFSSEIEEANEKARGSDLVSGKAKKAGEIMADLRVISPLPQQANPDVAEVILAQKKVQPSFDDVMQGIFSGQVSDIDKALQDLQDRMDKSLDDAIAAAQKKGADVSRDDWVFSNWDPESDYTLDMYEGR